MGGKHTKAHLLRYVQSMEIYTIDFVNCGDHLIRKCADLLPHQARYYKM